jgi:PAS domain-containing protein
VKYKNLLEETQESASVGGWQFDSITNELSWTEETFKVFGLDSSFQLSLESMSKLFEDEAKIIFQNSIAKTLTLGEAFDLELQTVTRNNTNLWIRATCKPISVYDKVIKLFGTFQNITSLKESALKLKESEDLFRSIYENIKDGIFISYPNGEIIQNKKTAFKLLDNDYPVIIVVGAASKCTDGGHFMVLTGKRGDTLYVNDSKSDQAPNFCSTIQTSEPGQKGYIFIHPPGQPNIGQNCITEWSYGCTSNTDCCSGLKCVNHGHGERKCQSCIPLWEYEANGLPCCNGLHYITDQYGNKCAPSS